MCPTLQPYVSNPSEVVEKFQRTPKRVLLLDWGGTRAPADPKA